MGLMGFDKGAPMRLASRMKWTVSILLTAAFLPALVSAQDVELWPEGAPGAKGKEQNDIPTMKVFPLPAGAKEAVPAVLLIPGGGYKHISGYGQYWEFFKDKPVRFFSMKYRLPVHGYQHPAPLQDAGRAVSLIRANAEKWGIDPDRVMVVAFSSGGHVATTLATHFTEGDPKSEDHVSQFNNRPDAMALFCPVVSMTSHPHRPSVVRLLGPEPSDELLNELSNELHVTEKTPPTFLAHAEDDTLVPPQNSEMFHKALKKAGVKTELKIYPSGGHGVVNDTNPWQEDLQKWMVEVGFLAR